MKFFKKIFWLCVLATVVTGQEPAHTAWLVNPQVSTIQNQQLAGIQPEVHSVVKLDRKMEIRSAGISLFYLGLLQTPVGHVERKRQLRFEIPRFPVPETRTHVSVRPDVLGAFVNGLPVFNQFEGMSFQGQNLWHFDPVALNDDGAFVAMGRPRPDLTHKNSWGVLENLFADGTRHSPIIGFAFDGYPIYGPWGFSSENITGVRKKMRSGYQLRRISRRIELPDGTRLTPGQYGPEINSDFPLGSFVEDYEFVSGSGDLDEFNGSFVKTPEYPNGTYAYFLSSDSSGRLAFPYLLTGKYFGKVSAEELSRAFTDSLDQSHQTISDYKKQLSLKTATKPAFSLQISGEDLTAGVPVRLSFQALNGRQQPIRFLEFVHERPLHLIVVLEDLSEFVHIHPELVAGDRYEITHIFKSGGRYRLYADFTPPGEAQRIESFEVAVSGKPHSPVALIADKNWVQETNGIKIEMTTTQGLRSNEDLELNFTIRDKATGKPPENLMPYLGAWAHFVIIDEKLKGFIHAHPLNLQPSASPSNVIHIHNENVNSSVPPPSEIRTITSFPQPGIYKIWAQFQVGDSVIAEPFIVKVGENLKKVSNKISMPINALQLKINANGFVPAILKIQANKATKIAVTRDSRPNCGNKIVIPSLGISRELPLGQTIVIELPAQPVGEFHFTCGMGMYKGAIVVN